MKKVPNIKTTDVELAKKLENNPCPSCQVLREEIKILKEKLDKANQIALTCKQKNAKLYRASQDYLEYEDDRR